MVPKSGTKVAPSRIGSNADNKFHMPGYVTIDGTLTFKTAPSQARSYQRLYVNHRLSNLRKFSITLVLLQKAMHTTCTSL